MKKENSIRLLAIDLDGTLLNEKYELNEIVRESIIRVQSEGILVVIATGRDRKSANPFLQAIEAYRYAITSGGSLIWINDHYVKMNSLTKFQVVNILSLGKKYNTGVFIDQPEQSWQLGNKTYIDLYTRVNNLISDRRIEELLNPLPVKITLIQENKTLLEIRQQLENQGLGVSMVFSSNNILDLCPINISKGSALAYLSRKLRIRKNQIASVGDSENDISMFQASKLSFAMGNAPLEVQRTASYVVPSNTKNGIVTAIDIINSLK